MNYSFIRRASLLLSVYFYFLAFYLVSSLRDLPSALQYIYQFYESTWKLTASWIANTLLKIPIVVDGGSGSGDTTYHYIIAMCWLVLSLIIAALGAYYVKRSSFYHQYYRISRIVFRYMLVYVMFMYGFAKIIKLQFPFPDLIRLTQTYGDSSPMGLAWTFFGYSTGYNLFLGSVEVLCGILLLFKRTTFAGSILAVIVLTNIVAINLAYDIPVKLLSLNLLLLSIWILWPDRRRLKALLVPTFTFSRIENDSTRHILKIITKLCTILLLIYFTLFDDWVIYKNIHIQNENIPLYGVYDIQNDMFEVNTAYTGISDVLHWKQLIFTYPGMLAIKSGDGSIIWMKLSIDSIQKDLTITQLSNNLNLINLSYRWLDDKTIEFRSKSEGDSFRMVVKKLDTESLLLINREFNWISEYPFNR